MSKGAPNVRYAEIDRETPYTKTHLVLDLEGGSRRDVATGVVSFDDLLRDLARYAGIDLGVSVEADVATADHHIVEDVGVSLGKAIRSALEDSDSVIGVGSCSVPSGDALVTCAMDISGRRHLGWQLSFARDWVGNLATENIKRFFLALSDYGDFSLHCIKLAGENDVHLSEAVFRSFGRSLYLSTRRKNGSN